MTATNPAFGPAITSRAIGRDDVPAWRELLETVEAHDDLGEHYSEQDLVEELEDPDLVPGDLVGSFDGDHMVGFWSAIHHGESEGRMRIHLQGAVLPSHRNRSLGTLQVAAMVARAERLHATRGPDRPALLMTLGRTDNHAQAQLLADVGLTPERWSFRMDTELAASPPDSEPPAGYRLLRYEPSWDDRMRRAHNDAFQDHPNFASWSSERWRHWVTDSHHFRPELSLVAVSEAEPEVVVAYLQASAFDADFRATGLREAYVGKVGTLREHRRHGLAGVLLRRFLADAEASGYAAAALDVDSENPTGALGVYERAGFRVRRRFTDYTRVLPPVTP